MDNSLVGHPGESSIAFIRMYILRWAGAAINARLIETGMHIIIMEDDELGGHFGMVQNWIGPCPMCQADHEDPAKPT